MAFARDFLVETLGINQKWFESDWLEFQLPLGVNDRLRRHALDDRRPEKFKMDYYQPGVRGVRASTRQGKFRCQVGDSLAQFGRRVKRLAHQINSSNGIGAARQTQTAGTVARPGGILGDGSISLSPAAPQ